MPLEIVWPAWPWLEPVEDQVSANVRRIVQTSKSDLMARGIAFNLLQMAKRIGPQCEAAEHEGLFGRKVSPWTMLLLLIEGDIGPIGDDTEELSMKAPMLVSKPADLG